MKLRLSILTAVLIIFTSISFAQPYPFAATTGPYGGTTFAICRALDGSIVAGTEVGIQRSTNHGVTWSPALNTNNFWVEDIICDSSGVLYASGSADIMRSPDNGVTWNSILSNPHPAFFYGIAKRGNTLYAAALDSGAYRTTDGGLTWTHLISGLPVNQYLFICAVNDSILLLSSNNAGLFRSTDNGDHWVEADSSFSSLYPWRIVQSPNGTVYAGSGDYGVYHSTDLGVTWSTGTGYPLYSLAMGLAVNGQYVYAGIYSGVERSTDGGNTWHTNSTGLTPTTGYSLLAGDSSIVYCGCERYGMFRSLNNGVNWAISNNGFSGYFPFKMAATPGGAFWYGTTTGAFVTTNNGTTWNNGSTGLPNATYRAQVYAFAEKDSTMYCSVMWYGIYRRSGNTWLTTNNGLPAGTTIYAQSICAGADNSLYFGDNTGVYYTSLDSINWINRSNGLSGDAIVEMCAHPDGSIFALALNSGLYKSTNHSVSWNPAMNGVLATTCYTIGVDSAGTLFLGTRRYGVYRSTNAGSQWINSTDGMPDSVNILGFAFGPNNQVYCIDSYRDVYYSGNGGLLWQLANMGLPENAFIQTIGIDHDGYLYAGLVNNVVYRSQSSTAVTGKVVWAPVPTTVELLPNYPNPFNPTTTIRFSLPQKANDVTLKIFDVTGREVATLLNRVSQPAGMHTVKWNGEGLASGSYFVRLETGIEVRTQRMMLLK